MHQMMIFHSIGGRNTRFPLENMHYFDWICRLALENMQYFAGSVVDCLNHHQETVQNISSTVLVLHRTCIVTDLS